MRDEEREARGKSNGTLTTLQQRWVLGSHVLDVLATRPDGHVDPVHLGVFREDRPHRGQLIEVEPDSTHRRILTAMSVSKREYGR